MINKSIQVKGTLPLIAEYFKTDEKRIYSIFNLDSSKETNAGKKVVKNNNKERKTK